MEGRRAYEKWMLQKMVLQQALARHSFSDVNLGLRVFGFRRYTGRSFYGLQAEWAFGSTQSGQSSLDYRARAPGTPIRTDTTGICLAASRRKRSELDCHGLKTFILISDSADTAAAIRANSSSNCLAWASSSRWILLNSELEKQKPPTDVLARNQLNCINWKLQAANIMTPTQRAAYRKKVSASVNKAIPDGDN